MDFLNKIHPERNIDNFTKFDGTVTFYSFVKAIMLRTNASKVLDFGAGRGSFWHLNSEDNGSLWRRHLQSLQFNGAEVSACDIDQVVMSHPCSDKQYIIENGEPLPFADNSFDVIVSDFVFEHIENPAFICRELKRILKKGGYICARTPNRYGYVKFFTGLAPNNLHTKFLKFIQPSRKIEDVFPTRYQLNSIKQIKRHFRDCAIYYYRDSGEPAYYFGNLIFYRFFQFVHWITPTQMSTAICCFIRKT